MLNISKSHQWLIGSFLVLLMLITRGHHFFTIHALPSASWAVFLLAGFYLSSRWWFPALLVLAGVMDFVAIYWGGVSSYCVSPAYSLLIPAYGSLWLAGHWYQKRYQFHWSTLLSLIPAVIISVALATLFSSGGFYWFSGRYEDPSFGMLLQNLSFYTPQYLANVLFYIGVAAICHIAFKLTVKTGTRQQQN